MSMDRRESDSPMATTARPDADEEARIRLQRRAVLIEMARRRQRPGSGSGPEFLRERTARMQFPDLRPVLAPVGWAVIGAAATRLYMPERVTDDLDILVRAEDAGTVRQLLTEAGFSPLGALSIGGNRWTAPDGFPVDVIECREAWRDQALSEAASNRDPHGSPVLTLPYLVLLKLGAGRVQDLADATRMLGLADSETLEAVRTAFRRWRPEECDDLESLITLGQLETRSPSE